MTQDNQLDESSKKPCKKRAWLYSRLVGIPVLGDSLRIANAYTYDGDRASDFGFAPWHCWVKKHWSSLLIVVFLTTISSLPICLNDFLSTYFPAILKSYAVLPKQTPPSPSGLILAIFPNLLGFGIGVYALIFSLSASFVKRLQKHLQPNFDTDSPAVGSALLLNADMAFPLVVMAISLGIAVIQQIFPNARSLELLAWAALWYSLLMSFEILGALFGLGENEILEKLNEPPKTDCAKLNVGSKDAGD